jgi:catechol 2,3-dioxygenase-like lactoylglutathione lyase family enzyme
MIEEIKALETITLFVDDLGAARKFYASVFNHTHVYEDDNCWVFRIGGLMINLLRVSEAAEVIAPLVAGGKGPGPRALLTVKVEDVDAVCATLKTQGVTLLNGPIDRPWGRRTAAFTDPDSNVWEIAQEIGKGE